jgi:catechol 2,3-dioxygenase-like lactoylglutathione lyase family enzyme
MGLSDQEIRPSVAVADVERARAFYEGQLGLSGEAHGQDGSYVYACGAGTALHVYPSAEHAGKGPATVATWLVDDVEGMVEDLGSNGVAFEHHDEPLLKTDSRGVFTDGDFQVAWFNDPDGNTFAIESR